VRLEPKQTYFCACRIDTGESFAVFFYEEDAELYLANSWHWASVTPTTGAEIDEAAFLFPDNWGSRPGWETSKADATGEVVPELQAWSARSLFEGNRIWLEEAPRPYTVTGLATYPFHGANEPHTLLVVLESPDGGEAYLDARHIVPREKYKPELVTREELQTRLDRGYMLARHVESLLDSPEQTPEVRETSMLEGLQPKPINEEEWIKVCEELHGSAIPTTIPIVKTQQA
jgi:hypothetical protein